MITPDAVLSAEQRIRDHVRITPFQESHLLSGDGCLDVGMKLENFQETGSFKLRGAFNKLLTMDASSRSRGVVTASTGNHGAAVARSGRILGVPVRVFVPETADPGKLDAIEADGASMVKIGRDCVETESAARAHAASESLEYLSPYNDPDVIAGQGTIGVELMSQVKHLDAVFIAVGGGGLISGVGVHLKSVNPSLEVVACSPRNSAVMHHSLKSGRILDMESQETLSDATAGGIESGSITFDICRNVVDSSVLVSESEIISAMRLLIGGHHLMVEGAAGVAVAGFLKCRERLAGRSVGIILCGANASAEVLRKVMS